MPLNHRVSARERRWVWFFAAGVIVLTTLPYLVGFASQGKDWRFTGFVFGVEDGNSYIAKMLGGSAGNWLFRTPYTAEPQNGAWVYLPYVLLGKLAAPPAQHEQLVALYHLFRFVAGILAILATYDFLAIFLRNVTLRRIGLVLATVGGGLGWVLISLGQTTWLGSLPLEFYSPETFGFLALYGLPHLALGRALLLWGFVRYLARLPEVSLGREVEKPGWRKFTWWIFSRDRHEGCMALQVGMCWLLIGFLQPLTVVVAWVVCLAYLISTGIGLVWLDRVNRGTNASIWWRTARRGPWAVLVSSPMVVYTLWVFQTDEILKTWASQNVITSPHPLHYLLAYGGLLPFALVGVQQGIMKKTWCSWLPLTWLFLFPFLAYAPFTLQRRLPEGVWVVIVALALMGVERCRSVRLFGVPLAKFFHWVLLPFLVSTLLLLWGGMRTASLPARPAFQPIGQVEAFQFLAQEADPGSIVLAAYKTGNPLPAWVPVRVLIGHGPESVHLNELHPRVASFFRATATDAERLLLLAEYDVRYVFWGPAEWELGEWNPNVASFLRLVFQRGDYWVFEVVE
ncbi:MAG: hypothetical protein AB1345_14300 [Chloroflexota bacterium]